MSNLVALVTLQMMTTQLLLVITFLIVKYALPKQFVNMPVEHGGHHLCYLDLKCQLEGHWEKERSYFLSRR